MAIQFPRPDAGSVRPGFRREIWSQPDGHSTAELYDEMFRRRAQDYPEALTLDFWTNHPVTEAVRRRGVTGQRLLDCGCGTGEISIHLARAGAQVTAYDLSPVALAVARRHLAQEPASVRAALYFVEGREGPLPFESHSFDTILLSHVLEHVAHPGPLLKDLARLLCPGGSLLIFTPRERFYDDPTHVHHFTRDALAELLNNYFEHVTATGIDDDRQLFAVCSNSTARDYPRMICQMRIKNEERWLNDVLDQIALVADGVVILDDGSTDNTPALCAAHPAVIEYAYQAGASLDEARDKNLLLQMAMRHRPDWLLCMDGDELLEDGAAPRIYDAIRHCPAHVSTLDVQFLYMWDDLDHYRSDGIYGRIFHHRLFTLTAQAVERLAFKSSRHGGNLHCESVPANLFGESREIDIRIKHLGYMHRSDRLRKYEWYCQKDPAHAAQGYYEHLLDQPGMIIEKWRERPECRSLPGPQTTTTRRQIMAIWA
ncbi:MAG: methyltransferase domain-containing protein [bacterium]|nr:methyltransferase domain-containing protein [bacterium]